MSKYLFKIDMIVLGALLLLAAPARAEVKIGMTVSATGPAASMGIVQRNVIDLLPSTIDGEAIKYIVLDDGSQATVAVQNTHQLIDVDGVDIVFGATLTPLSLPMIDVVAAAGTPMISMGSGETLVTPMDAKKRWVFKTNPNPILLVAATVEHMKQHQVKRLGYIGLDDASDESYFNAVTSLAKAAGIEVVDIERFNRNDQSVLPQILRLLAARPDAVYIGAYGTPGALPLLELRQQGFKGLKYANTGVANNDFLRIAGPSAEGLTIANGPLSVASELPNSNPIKPVALDIISKYEAKYGEGSSSLYIAYSYDCFLLFQNAFHEARQKATPGTPQFRAALRDAIEATHELIGTQGVYDMTPDDHTGYDQRASVMTIVKNGKFHLAD